MPRDRRISLESLRTDEEIIEDDLQMRINYYRNILENAYLSPEWREEYELMLKELEK